MTMNGVNDEEMVGYKKSALNTVSFHIVRDTSDLDGKKVSFKPDMAHQIFGETEMIFGYRSLSIDIYYLHNSAKAFVNLQSSGRIPDCELYKADDIMGALNPWLPENYRTSKEDFMKDLQEEKHDIIFGKIINTFQNQKDNSTYKITICDALDPDFKEFHQRFETFIIWFIDGANFIDLDDIRWMIFYVYEEYLDENTQETHTSPVGFATVYKFFLYPNSIRPRISQFFVLPSHQKRGIGTNLYRTVFNYLKELPEVQDITVEEPTQNFQNIRDFCDTLYIHNDPHTDNISRNIQSPKKINQYFREHKICKRQSQRILDILKCLDTFNKGKSEYDKVLQSIKTRIANEIEKETRGSKKICNLERMGIVSEPMDKKAAVEAESAKYIYSLEWPLNRLRLHLSKAL